MYIPSLQVISANTFKAMLMLINKILPKYLCADGGVVVGLRVVVVLSVVVVLDWWTGYCAKLVVVLDWLLC